MKYIENQRFIEVMNFLIFKRKAKNKTQFAAKLGLISQSIYDIEINKVKVSDKILKKAEQVFDVNKDYILTGEGEMLISSRSGVNIGGSVKGSNNNNNSGNYTNASIQVGNNSSFNPNDSAYLHKVIEEKDRINKENMKRLEEKDKVIAQKDNLLAQKDKQISELYTKVIELNERIIALMSSK